MVMTQVEPDRVDGFTHASQVNSPPAILWVTDTDCIDCAPLNRIAFLGPCAFAIEPAYSRKQARKIPK